MSDRYLCSNCRNSVETDHDGMGGPMCPDCNVQEMTEMRQPECGDCDSTTFTIYDSPSGRMGHPEPQVECVDCGWNGRIDSDGVWY